MSIVAQKNHVYTSGQSSLIQGDRLDDQQGAKGSLSREQRIGKIHLPPYLGWNLASAGREDYPSDPTLLRTPAFRAI